MWEGSYLEPFMGEPQEQFNSIYTDNEEIIKLLVSIIKTSKNE